MASFSSVKSGGDGSFSIRVTNLDAFLRSLNDYSSAVRRDAQAALESSMRRRVFDLAQQWCPYDTGRMYASGELRVDYASGHMRASISYDTPYAIYVHENPDARHKAPTRWKWLEEAYARNVDKVLADVRRAVIEANR